MANLEHVDTLKQGVEVWRQWREKNPDVIPDLSHAGLYGANLYGADLSFADLRSADLNFADLIFAHLSGADLTGSNLNGADLERANLSGAVLWYTSFGDVDLCSIKGLEEVEHKGPSFISTSTLSRSQGDIPEVFLQGAGVSDAFITYARSLLNKPIEYHTCFISYSNKDQGFAERLHADLQSKGVRCWFALEEMKIGDKIRHRIDESIRLYDKLLLVLSEHSVASQWVEPAVATAIGKELEGKPNVLFPIRLDNAVLESKTGWASHIKLTRHIGDFTQWKQHDDYQRAFTRLLR